MVFHSESRILHVCILFDVSVERSTLPLKSQPEVRFGWKEKLRTAHAHCDEARLRNYDDDTEDIPDVSKEMLVKNALFSVGFLVMLVVATHAQSLGRKIDPSQTFRYSFESTLTGTGEARGEAINFDSNLRASVELDVSINEQDSIEALMRVLSMKAKASSEIIETDYTNMLLGRSFDMRRIGRSWTVAGDTGNVSQLAIENLISIAKKIFPEYEIKESVGDESWTAMIIDTMSTLPVKFILQRQCRFSIIKNAKRDPDSCLLIDYSENTENIGPEFYGHKMEYSVKSKGTMLYSQNKDLVFSLEESGEATVGIVDMNLSSSQTKCKMHLLE